MRGNRRTPQYYWMATSRSRPRYARLKKRSGALAMCSGAFQNPVSDRTSSSTWTSARLSWRTTALTRSWSPNTHTGFVEPDSRQARSAAVVTKVALAELLLAFRRLSTGTDGRRDARTSMSAVDLQALRPGEKASSLFISISVFRRTALPPTVPDCREEICAPRQSRGWPAAD